MGTTRGVLCPQDRAFLHTNVAIPPGMMRDQSLQRGYLLVVLHAIVLRAPELFYPICPSIVCHDLSLSHTRSEEHTSELQSLMRISYAVFCLKKKKNLNRLTPSTQVIHYCLKHTQLISTT